MLVTSAWPELASSCSAGVGQGCVEEAGAVDAPCQAPSVALPTKGLGRAASAIAAAQAQHDGQGFAYLVLAS